MIMSKTDMSVISNTLNEGIYGLKSFRLNNFGWFRFCTEDYEPLDVHNVNKYVVGDDYIPWTDVSSLKKDV